MTHCGGCARDRIVPDLDCMNEKRMSWGEKRRKERRFVVTSKRVNESSRIEDEKRCENSEKNEQHRNKKATKAFLILMLFVFDHRNHFNHESILVSV